MTLTTLGGPVSSFEFSIRAYREALSRSGYEPKEMPVATTGWFYAAETTEQAFREAYPFVNQHLLLANGQGYPKQQFAQGKDKRNALVIGSPQEIIEKILYQHEVFGQQRYIAQFDFGGMPFDKMQKNIEFIGNEILPAIKKYTKKK